MSKRCLKTEDDLLYELERAVDKYPTDSAAARAFGVSRGHLSRVLSRQKRLTAKVAHRLGYAQEYCYVRYEQRD